MKFNSSRMKKVLLLSAVVLFAVSAAGCSVPTDETGAVKQITSSTTFNETMNSRSFDRRCGCNCRADHCCQCDPPGIHAEVHNCNPGNADAAAGD